MKKQNIIISLLLISYGICGAQSNFGPKTTAMGQNAAAVTDVWNVIGNPALVAKVPSPTLALNYSKYLINTDLSAQAIGFVIPFNKQALGFYVSRYGIMPYHEIKASFILAKQFGNQLSIAIRSDFHQLKIQNYGAIIGFSLDVGASYSIADDLIIGVYADNLSAENYNSLVDKPIPIGFYFGLCYLVSDKVTLASTVRKELDSQMDVGLGFDYKLLNAVSLRAGLTLYPFTEYGGLGFNFKKLTVDITVQNDSFLAYTPQIGIAYAF